MVRFGTWVSLLGGAILLAFALAGVLSVASLILPMFVYSLGLGLSMPNAMSGALSQQPHIAGTASALMGFLQMAVGALGSALVAALPGETDLPMALVTSGMARPFVRQIIERFRRETPVLSQSEIHPRAKLRTVGSV